MHECHIRPITYKKLYVKRPCKFGVTLVIGYTYIYICQLLAYDNIHLLRINFTVHYAKHISVCSPRSPAKMAELREGSGREENRILPLLLWGVYIKPTFLLTQNISNNADRASLS